MKTRGSGASVFQVSFLVLLFVLAVGCESSKPYTIYKVPTAKEQEQVIAGLLTFLSQPVPRENFLIYPQFEGIAPIKDQIFVSFERGRELQMQPSAQMIERMKTQGIIIKPGVGANWTNLIRFEHTCETGAVVWVAQMWKTSPREVQTEVCVTPADCIEHAEFNFWLSRTNQTWEVTGVHRRY